METTIKVIANQDGFVLVFKTEDEAEEYSQYLPSNVTAQFLCHGGYMNAIRITNNLRSL